MTPILVTYRMLGSKGFEAARTRITEQPNYYAIHPEYRVPKRLTPKPLGEEYTSANTRRLERPEEIGALLDAMGEVEVYI